MAQRRLPGVDRSIEPQHGVSRNGQALSYNRAPASDLAPWLTGLYVTMVEAPSDHRMDCGLFNDTSLLRIQLKGLWNAHTKDGERLYERASLVFGPQSRRMPIAVTGSFISVGISFRPGTCNLLFGIKEGDYLDRLAFSDEWNIAGEDALATLERGSNPEEWLQFLEGLARERIERSGAQPPDPVSTRFEFAAYADPNLSVSEFAREIGVDQRRLERIIRRDFGMPPKQVLRRARALDMASHLRGVADQNEAEEIMLRYYDQSHLIREFTQLFGMSPRQFVVTPQPILTFTLESRQARRLEALRRLKPGDVRPWQ